jgi:hypothetical protein
MTVKHRRPATPSFELARRRADRAVRLVLREAAAQAAVTDTDDTDDLVSMRAS